MSYTPTTWTTGDAITASAMNKIEQGIANAGGSAIVELSATGYGSATQIYGSIVYGVYDGTKWVVSTDDDNYWNAMFGYSNEAPKIIPPYLTVLPNSNNVALFFVANFNNSASVSVTGDISATNLYYSFGSVIPNAYRITGNGSISLDNG